MGEVLTKDKLEVLIKEQITAQLDARGVEITDTVKGVMKEVMEETLRDVGKSKKTPFDTGEEDATGGFKNFADFAGEVYRSGEGMTHPSPRLMKWNEKASVIMKAAGDPSQTVGSLQAGGALIPPEYSRTALVRANDRSSIMSKCMIIPMASDVIEIPYIVDFDNSQGKVAGNVKFRWVSENAVSTANQVQFALVELRLREANAMIYVSNRMMDFSPVSIQPFLTTATDSALDLCLAAAFLNGTGVGQPLGVLNSAALVTIAKEVGQSADTIVYENTLKLLARFYGKNGDFYASRTIIPQLGVMNVTIGGGGSAVFIANSGGVLNASGQFPSSLHGAPLAYEQVMPILGDAGDLLFVDWSQYLIGRFNGQQGLSLTESAHLKFDYRQHAFQFTFYTDGRPWWPNPFTPKHGDTLSPFVCIEAR
ncbi:MAG: phage major capsid protein [Dehalococcoidales bacterium]|nr:phage major capsid protein [Dehalococcoidales bacterium]